jgi:hypothetical protein
MKWRTLAGGFVLAVTFATAVPHGTVSGSGAVAPAADSATAFSPDKGKFRILQNGAEVGTEEFELAPSGNAWVAHGEAVIHVAGSDSRSSGQLRLAADGTPLHYDWTAQAGKKSSGTVDFEGGTAKTSITISGKDPVREDFKFDSPHVAILDNNLYDQWAILARLYDWNVGGAQNFPVVIPQDMTPGSIAVESLGPKTVDGKQFDTLHASTADLEVNLYFDAKHHLMRLEVPAAQAVIIRE